MYIFLRIFTENGTAFSSRDFTHVNQIGQFNPGAGNGATVSFSIPISDDVVVENTESFYVQLAKVDSALQVVNPNRSTVLIQDNDGECSTRDKNRNIDTFEQLFTTIYLNISCLHQAFEAQFTHGDLTVDEEDGSVQTSVRLNGQHERDVTIR